MVLFRWLWVIPLAFLWPLIHTLVFAVRFGELPPGGIQEALVFLPMGLVAAVALVILWGRAPSRRRKNAILLGYLLASPAAFILSLFSGLMFPPWLGTTLFGAGPLLLGMILGDSIAKNDPSPD